jgi:hypothetical protein
METQWPSWILVYGGKLVSLSNLFPICSFADCRGRGWYYRVVIDLKQAHFQVFLFRQPIHLSFVTNNGSQRKSKKSITNRSRFCPPMTTLTWYSRDPPRQLNNLSAASKKSIINRSKHCLPMTTLTWYYRGPPRQLNNLSAATTSESILCLKGGNTTTPLWLSPHPLPEKSVNI